MLGNGDDVAASDLGNSNTAVRLVGGVEVNVVGTDTGGDSQLELLGLGQTLGIEVARMEAGVIQS